MSGVKNNNEDFFPGVLEYHQEIKNSEDVLSLLTEADMKLGFAAFSKGEIKLPRDDFSIGIDLLNKRTTLKNCDGYLMELNLWENDGTVYEEIAVERTDEGFLTQTWKLNTTKKENGNCLYRFREHPVLENSMLYGGKIQTIETIMPEHRLHFFITIGEKDG